MRVGRVSAALAVVSAALSLAACATAPPPTSVSRLSDGRPRAYNRPYEVRGRWYTPTDQPGYDKVGLASWYSYESPSRTTADGERFDIRVPTAAHTTLPIPSWLEVTNLDNGRSLKVRLNDRGPFVSGRILDLSRGAAEQLGFLQRGTARVRVRYLGPAGPPDRGNTPMWADAQPARPTVRVAAPNVLLARDDIQVRPLASASAAAEVAEDASQTPDEGSPPPVTSTDFYSPAPLLRDGAPAPASSPASSGGFAVQAGAFSDRGNAERAARRLATAGAASIRPLDRNGEVLYRVVVAGGWSQATDAAAGRSQIVALGFPDAKVVAP
ncbi:septal ring lytic transglycosylase RlpA family protein [Caulobacter sp. S45]|uniref:septal ring lytic transglycosylase RlpA family protein n=1 Tax=Caulobacter sp. S45 TaxID=1641861 RepID=UPI0020C5EBD3|nr:septal ring lytic transglycosylase RlpA family protein [Caulobacter sp. S45]